MWKLACGDEAEALTTSLTSGVFAGRFSHFRATADVAPTLGGVICLVVTDSRTGSMSLLG